MPLTVALPQGIFVADVHDRVRDALYELERLEPNRYALAHWLAHPFRRALVVGARESGPCILRVSSDVGVVILEAQRALANMRAMARRLDGAFVAKLPPRVHVVRVKDETGDVGFAPIDVPDAPLTARGLALLLADYLTCPEDFADDERAA
jgi:hypothetical protein